MDRPPPPAPRTPLQVLLPILIAVLTFASFLPSLHGAFLNWDDDTNFLNNLNYRGLSPQHLRWMFTDYYGHYMPLTWLTLGFDYVVWGMNPLGYHLTNTALHALNAVLVYLLFAALLRRARPEVAPAATAWAAAAGALFFSIHPLRVESVAWITERRDVLSGAFFLLTFLCYLRMTGEPEGTPMRRKWLALSALSFAAMLLSKTMGLTLPLVLLVLDVYPLRRFSRDSAAGLLREKIPHVSLMIAGLIMLSISAGKAAGVYSVEQYPIAQSLAQPGFRVCFYVWKTLLPFNLSPHYFFRPDLGWPQVIGWVFLLGISSTLLVQRHRVPAALAAWISYGVLIVPVSGLRQFSSTFASDHFTYLPCLPFAALVSGAVLLPSERSLRIGVGSLAAALLLGLGILTWRQCGVWKDSIALWDQALRLDPHVYLSLNNRGTARAERGDWTGAMEDYNASIALYPDWPKPWYNRGVARASTGDPAGAIEDFTEAIRRDPRHSDAYAARALARSKTGDPGGGLADSEEALRISPDSAGAWANRGGLRLGQGDLAGAISDYTRSLDLNPTQAGTWNSRGLAYARSGKLPEAARDYTRSIELRPGHAETWANRAVARSLANDPEGALADFSESLRLKPDPATYLRRATARGGKGDLEGAVADCSEAIRLKPDFADAYARRGVALSERGSPEAAARDFEKALEIAPSSWPQRRQIEQFLQRVRSPRGPK